MTQAWQARESDRQEMLEDFKKKILDLEETHGRKKIDYELSREILRFLQDGKLRFGGEGNPPRIFLKEVLASLAAFTNGIEERDLIICDLLAFLTESIRHEFRARLMTAEQADPEKFFGAASATARVRR